MPLHKTTSVKCMLKAEVLIRTSQTPRSWKKALEWYRMAADPEKANNADAQFNLAEMYRRGKGVDKDLTENKRREKAVEWYEKAAKQGNPRRAK